MSESEQGYGSDEYADWDLYMPLIADDADDAGFRIKNQPGGETHRVMITGYDRTTEAAVRGRLFHVVHGMIGSGRSSPATLIVFEWLLIPGQIGRRFRQVDIDVTFAYHGQRPGMMPGADLTRFTPEIKTIAPEVLIPSYLSSKGVTEEKGKSVSLNMGYQPYASLSHEFGKSSTEAMERMDYRFIAGYPAYVNRSYGNPNSVHWTLQENESQESGTPHRVRTAVLLERRAGDYGMFTASVKTSVNVSTMVNAVETLRKMVGLVPKDDAIYFDPKAFRESDHGAAVLFGSRDVAKQKSPCDKTNLGAEELALYLLEDDVAKQRVKAGLDSNKNDESN